MSAKQLGKLAQVSHSLEIQKLQEGDQMKGAVTKSFCLRPCTQYQGTEHSWREDDRVAANVISVARRQALHQTLYTRNLMQLYVYELGTLIIPILQRWQLRTERGNDVPEITNEAEHGLETKL